MKNELSKLATLASHPSTPENEWQAAAVAFRQINREPYREPTGPVLRTATGHPVQPRWMHGVYHRDECR